MLLDSVVSAFISSYSCRAACTRALRLFSLRSAAPTCFKAAAIASGVPRGCCCGRVAMLLLLLHVLRPSSSEVIVLPFTTTRHASSVDISPAEETSRERRCMVTEVAALLQALFQLLSSLLLPVALQPSPLPLLPLQASLLLLQLLSMLLLAASA